MTGQEYVVREVETTFAVDVLPVALTTVKVPPVLVELDVVGAVGVVDVTVFTPLVKYPSDEVELRLLLLTTVKDRRDSVAKLEAIGVLEIEHSWTKVVDPPVNDELGVIRRSVSEMLGGAADALPYATTSIELLSRPVYSVTVTVTRLMHDGALVTAMAGAKLVWST